ncbi:hypothetical protein NL676_033100 [Syzygium grande]|nr:hypothetical protein NL676_033100 [Syzygium grande]
MERDFLSLVSKDRRVSAKDEKGGDLAGPTTTQHTFETIKGGATPDGSCIFLLSDSGEVMLEKQLTGHRVDRSICAWYWDHAISQGDQLQPVIASPTHYLFQIVREAITFLACSQVEMPPLMGIEFLCRAADVLADYLGGLNEDVIKDNFVIVYES